MITVFGGGLSRSFRVVWLLEEMGLEYRLRPVDMLAEPEKDAEFMAVNPACYIPALQDGEVTMVESVAIMEYLMGRYGPTPLAPGPQDPAFPAYQQFLHLAEAGLNMPLFTVVVASFLAPEAQRRNWSVGHAMEGFERRRKLVALQLERSAYLAGDSFTAADIAVGHVLVWAAKYAGIKHTDAEQVYVARLTAREGFKRALEMSDSSARRG